MNQLQKYTWLIDTIRRAGKIYHKDLSEKWERGLKLQCKGSDEMIFQDLTDIDKSIFC